LYDTAYNNPWLSNGKDESGLPQFGSDTGDSLLREGEEAFAAGGGEAFAPEAGKSLHRDNSLVVVSQQKLLEIVIAVRIASAVL
jgi:hypothetical protein